MLIGGALGLLWGAFISWAWRLLCDQGDWGEGELPDENNLISKALRWERRVEGISSWCSLTQATVKEKLFTVWVCVCVIVNTLLWKGGLSLSSREEKSKCACQMVTIINFKNLLIFVEATNVVFQSFKNTAKNCLRCDLMTPAERGCLVFNF